LQRGDSAQNKISEIQCKVVVSKNEIFAIFSSGKNVLFTAFNKSSLATNFMQL